MKPWPFEIRRTQEEKIEEEELAGTPKERKTDKAAIKGRDATRTLQIATLVCSINERLARIKSIGQEQLKPSASRNLADYLSRRNTCWK